jgi:hypothetical protein
MERSLYEGAFALGLVAWICCLLLMRRGTAGNITLRSLISFPFLVAAGVVPLVGFLAAFPSQPPFAPGQGLGRGLLLGAFGSLLTLWTMGRSLDADEEGAASARRSGVAFAAPFALAVVCACIPLLWMRGVVVDALLGVALGWLTHSLLLLIGLNTQEGAGRKLGLALTAGTGFAVTVVVLAALGEMGGSVQFGNSLLPVPWSAPLMPLAAAVPFLILLCELFRTGMSARPATSPARFWPSLSLVRWLIGGALLLFVGTQMAHKLGATPNLFRLLGIGLLAGGLSWWLLVSRMGGARDEANSGLSWRSMAVPVLTFMAAGMVAFQMALGMGMGVMLLGAWLTAGIALAGTAKSAASPGQTTQAMQTGLAAHSAASHLLRLLYFGTLLLLYRLFQVRYADDLRNVLLPDHYALLGFIFGAAAPAALAGYLRAGFRVQGSGGRDGVVAVCPSLPQVMAAGSLTLGIPALLLILFGTKCALCLFFGLALATVLGDSVYPTKTSDGEEGEFLPVAPELLTALFALAMGLALAQWTRHVLPAALMSRTDKIHLLTYGFAAIAALLAISEVGNWLRRAHTSPPSSHGKTLFVSKEGKEGKEGGRQ